MKIMSIAGARPNFMKMASIVCAVNQHNRVGGNPSIEHIIVHTGQHYDDRMSNLFFKELEIPDPHYNLEVGSHTHAVQTAQIMERFETVLLKEQPDVILVVGDVNSTVACALVASKVCYNGTSSRKRPLIGHVEAGLRSFDRDMPEEINRILTDALSDFLFITEEDAMKNLKKEGIPKEKIHFVGNVMIDTLSRHKEKALNSNTLETILRGNYTEKEQSETPAGAPEPRSRKYGVVTLHRPSNVDTLESLEPLIDAIAKIASRIPIIFPLHPRTENKLREFDLFQSLVQNTGIFFTKPMSYWEFLNLILNATLVLTDSGGIQEETTFLRIPCITLRNNTERPVTVTRGTNYLVGTDPDRIIQTAYDIIDGNKKKGVIPPFWDGKAGSRIIDILTNNINSTYSLYKNDQVDSKLIK